MGRKWMPVWAVLAVLLALLTAILPVRVRIQEEMENRQALALLERRVDELEEQEKIHQRNLARWYNLNLSREDPDPGFQEAYGSILNFGAGMMGTLTIPELELCLPITHGEGGDVGHDPASALPIGGRGNHTVLYLHRSRFSHFPEPGTAVVLDSLGTSLIYRIDSVQVMPAGWPSDRGAEEGDLLTLVLEGRTGLSETRTLIRCSRSNTLDIQTDEEVPLLLSRAVLAAFLAGILPLAACIPGLVLRARTPVRKRHPSGVMRK